MIEWSLAIGTGLLAGFVHVVSGPDHMAAVLPFAVDAPRRSLRMGVLWGVGHGVGVLALGLLFIVLRESAAVEWLSSTSELLVGFLLVALGAWAFRRSRLITVHQHPHVHDSHDHSHHHVHFNDPTVGDERHASEGRHRVHHHSTLGFGFIHGLAGAGHLVVASPILAFSTTAAGLYLGSYLLGGMAAMTVFAYLAGWLIRRPAWIPRALQVAGACSVIVGLVWMSAFALA